MALIPENRKTQGLALTRSVGDNIVLAGLRKLFPSGFSYQGGRMKAARAIIDKLRIATPTPRRPVATLVRRQPAESRDRQMAERRCAVLHFR